jgi:hypothetical protein
MPPDRLRPTRARSDAPTRPFIHDCFVGLLRTISRELVDDGPAPMRQDFRSNPNDQKTSTGPVDRLAGYRP